MSLEAGAEERLVNLAGDHASNRLDEKRNRGTFDIFLLCKRSPMVVIERMTT